MCPRLKKIEKYDLISEIGAFFSIKPWMPIIPWIEKNITLVDDVSSESDKPDFSKYCYQIEPLKHWEDLHRRKHVTIVACEQLGKTSMFVYGILYRMIYKPRKRASLLSTEIRRRRRQTRLSSFRL